MSLFPVLDWGTYRTFFQYWPGEPRTFSQKLNGEPIEPLPSIGLWKK